MKHVLPAAAIPEGSIVKIPPEIFFNEDLGDEFEIDHVENSTPRPGKITWRHKDGHTIVIGGKIRVEVLKFPHEREDDK